MAASSRLFLTRDDRGETCHDRIYHVCSASPVRAPSEGPFPGLRSTPEKKNYDAITHYSSIPDHNVDMQDQALIFLISRYKILCLMSSILLLTLTICF